MPVGETMDQFRAEGAANAPAGSAVPASPPAPGELPRVIGVAGVAFTAFNCVVGVGIFVLPSLVAGVLGPAAILAYGVCLVLIGLVALCMAEAGSRVPNAGGLYAYAHAAFGPVIGGVAGMLLLFANAIGSAAALARFFIDTLATFWPAAGTPLLGALALVGIYSTLALVNVLGARDGSKLSVAIGIMKLTPLVALVAVGLFAIQPQNLAWPHVPPVAKIGEASLILVLAFIGIESGLSVSGETRNPSRTIPRAIALALGMIALLYIGLQTVTQGVLGDALGASTQPLADTAGKLVGPWGYRVIAVLTLASAGGYLVADMLSSPRVGYALAHDGQLPRFLAYVQPRFRTPAVAIVLYATLVVVLANSGSFRQIATLSVAGTLVLYLITCLSVLRLRVRKVGDAAQPFVVPGGRIVPIAATVIILWLLSTLALRELIAMLVFVLVASLLCLWTQVRRQAAARKME